MKSARDWLICLGCIAMLTTWLVGKSIRGPYFFWAHFLGFALGTALILGGASLRKNKKL